MKLNKPVPKTVAIIGMGASHIDYVISAAKWGNRRAVADEIWVINKLASVVRADMVWRMDDLRTEFKMNQKTIKTSNGDERAHDLWADTLKDLDIPIMTCQSYPEFPTSVTYPLEEVINYNNSSYINTTPSYAIAYAIYLGVEEIKLYGIDFSYPNRHESEKGRGCCEYWVRAAQERGIKIHVAQNSTLLDTNEPIEKQLYGYPYPIEIKKSEQEGKLYEVIPRKDVLEKKNKNQEDAERKYLQELLLKYPLDAPEGAVQESLIGDEQCQPRNDIQKELPT